VIDSSVIAVRVPGGTSHPRHTPTVHNLPELPSTAQTTLYSQDFLRSAAERFPREDLWLLLSIHHYGWRAHRDLAVYLLEEETQRASNVDLFEHHAEHRAMASLEELFLLLDQLWRMISGIEGHRGGGGFLAGFRRFSREISVEFERLQSLTVDDWRRIFTLPSEDELSRALQARGITDRLTVRETRVLIAGQANTARRNMDEVCRLFARVEDAAGAEARSVRDINNAYRHGTQVTYEDCAPSEIQWQAGNPEGAAGLLLGVREIPPGARNVAVNVLLEAPDTEGHARFASQPRDAVWADDLIHSMENLSVLLYKLVFAFLVGEVTGESVLGTLALNWDELSGGER
jgi:hypothetical protein